MLITGIFVALEIIIIAVVDVILYIRDKKEGDLPIRKKVWLTISGLMKFLYRKFPLVPYSVSVVFNGHFTDKIQLSMDDKIKIRILIAVTISMMIFSILSYIMPKSKVHKFNQKAFFIYLFFGYFIGDLFWDIH